MVMTNGRESSRIGWGHLALRLDSFPIATSRCPVLQSGPDGHGTDGDLLKFHSDVSDIRCVRVEVSTDSVFTLVFERTMHHIEMSPDLSIINHLGTYVSNTSVTRHTLGKVERWVLSAVR